MYTVEPTVSVTVELGLDPELLADPEGRILESRNDLGLTVLEYRTRLAARSGRGDQGEQKAGEGRREAGREGTEAGKAKRCVHGSGVGSGVDRMGGGNV